MNFIQVVFVLTSTLLVHSWAATELGRACKFSLGARASCGKNARCKGLSIDTPRTGLGICMCEKGYTQPARLPFNTQAAFQRRMGDAFWSDCVPVYRIGDRCQRDVGGGFQYYGSYGNNGGSYDYGNDQPVSDTAMPDGAFCSQFGTVECLAGQVASNDNTRCVAGNQGNQFFGDVGGRSYEEACDFLTPCDASLGLQCESNLYGEDQCKCRVGKWRGNACTDQLSFGDSCQRNSDCARGRPGNTAELRMSCSFSSDYGSYGYGGGSERQCDCPPERGILAAYVVTNDDILLRVSGTTNVGDAKSLKIMPVKLNETVNERQTAMDYWCMDDSVYEYASADYLERCETTTSKTPGSRFNYCQPGLACMYFPVELEDTANDGRCIPMDSNDRRWSGSEDTTSTTRRTTTTQRVVSSGAISLEFGLAIILSYFPLSINLP